MLANAVDFQNSRRPVNSLAKENVNSEPFLFEVAPCPSDGDGGLEGRYEFVANEDR